MASEFVSPGRGRGSDVELNSRQVPTNLSADAIW